MAEEWIRRRRSRGCVHGSVLVATPCGICEEAKGEALRPLLQARELELWTHLLMDLTTAQDLLPKEE